MDNALQIEATLRQSAADTLARQEAAGREAITAESDSVFLEEFNRLCALVDLARQDASGLSGATIAQLLELEGKAVQLFNEREARKAGSAGRSDEGAGARLH